VDKTLAYRGDVLVTFLIPTRKRLDMLKESMASIRATCNDVSSFEVVVIFDEDDVDTLNDFQKLNFDYQVKTIISKRHGYYGLHHYINGAFEVSSGKWFWLWNDDLKMVGHGWDSTILTYGDKFLVLNPANTHPKWSKYCMDATISPIVPRAWFEILDRFSAYNQYDTYINSVAYPLNLVVNENRLLNVHDQVVDEVSIGVSYEKMTLPKLESEKDQRLLRAYLGKKVLICYWIERLPYRASKYLRRKNHFRRMLSMSYISTRLTKSNLLKRVDRIFKKKS
jgi:hypothetical protein